MASPTRLPSRKPAAGGGRPRPMSLIDGPMFNLNLPQETGPTSKQAKRRSLLPTFARKVSTEDVIREDGGERDDASSAAGSISEEWRRSVEADKRAMPPPSRITRPTSVYGGLARAPSTRRNAHEAPRSTDARADALAALTGSAPMTNSSRAAGTGIDGGLKRTGSTRLPQSPASRGLSRTASVKPKDHLTSKTSSSSATAATTSNAAKRLSASRPRPPSIDSTLRDHAAPIPSPASPASSTTSRQSVTSKSLMPPPLRPAFSTFQQHYSPVKSSLPKPPIPSAKSMRAAIVTEDDIPISFDDMKQQNELLQLSLLYQAALRTTREFDESARHKLGRKQAILRREYESIRAAELEQQRVVNLTALEAWCPDHALLIELLQVLGKVYSEISALTEEGSRYAQLLITFEVWVEIPSHTSRSADFVESLPPDWHKAHTSLALRLRSLQRDLEMLPPAPKSEEQPSSLELLMASCTQLLSGMLRELELMTKLEKGVMEREKRRVDEDVKSLKLDEVVMGREPWVPAWQLAV